MSSSKELGQWGEEMAVKYLKNKGYTILDRNFRKKWGEIDIICSISSNVPRGTNGTQPPQHPMTGINARHRMFSRLRGLLTKKSTVPRGTNISHKSDISPKIQKNKIVFVEVKTLQSNIMRPEENVTPAKQKRLIKTCQLYLSHKLLSINTDWQIDVIGILLDKNTGKAKLEHIEQAVYFN